MAKKINFKGAGQAFDGTIAGVTFNPAMLNSVQVGDTFYVPVDNLVILGTAMEDRDASGNTRLDENGKPIMRSVGQRILVVHVIDGVPQGVRELYLGQIIKIDYARRVVYNNDLAKAYRSNNADAALKSLMCGKYLVVAEEGVCEDRIWDDEKSAYKRDEAGKFLHEPKTCYRWEVEIPGNLDKDKCEDMVADFFNENYSNLASPVQE